MPGKKETILHFPYPLDRTLFLVGMMGSGKSSIGRRLARIYSMPFVDADREIEKAGGGDICYLFQRYGEQDFRRVEERIMNRLLNGKNVFWLPAGGPLCRRRPGRPFLKKPSAFFWTLMSIRSRAIRRAGRTGRF